MSFDLETLQLAFELHIVNLIVEADEQVTAAESAWVEKHFPRAALKAVGLVDDNGEQTDLFHDAAMQALDELPRALTPIQKRALLEKFFAITLADGDFAYREGNVMLVAARLLGLSNDAVVDFLSEHPEVGEVSLADIDIDD